MWVFFLALPTVTRPPPGELTVHEGETVTIECEAIGVPPPLIVWRLNWGHIGAPPRITVTIERSTDRPGVFTTHSVLTITQSRKEDEGAYTCEALNTKGSIFAVPDTIVHILRKQFTDLCEIYSLISIRCKCTVHIHNSGVALVIAGPTDCNFSAPKIRGMMPPY